MKDALIAKLQQGRPVDFTPEEADYLVTRLREAMAMVLERPVADIADDALVYDALGLDSVDVFDLLDVLAEELDVQVDVEALPEGLLRGDEATTFRAFADGLLTYFRTPPEAPPDA